MGTTNVDVLRETNRRCEDAPGAAGPLRILIVEESVTEALRVIDSLRLAGLTIEYERVEHPASMRAALDNARWDVVLSDWSMPGFTALAALELLRRTGEDIPFIIVSAPVCETLTVAAMRAGAHDYVFKDSAARLAPAIEREVRACQGRGARRRAEDAERLTSARYQRIVETMSQGVALIDVDSRLTYANAQLAEMLGFEPDELIGRCIFDLVDTEHGADAEKAAADARPGVAARADRKLLRKDGLPIWAHCDTMPIFNDAGRYDGRLAILTDITERRRAEEALSIKDARIARLTGSGLIGITVCHTSGAIIEANDTFLDMLGFSREEFANGELDWTRLTPPEWGSINAEIAPGMGRFSRSPPREKEYFRKDGSRVPVLVGVAKVEAPYAISVSIDLTELKRAERALQASESRFARLAESGIIGIASTDIHGNLQEANDAYLSILGYDRSDFAAGKLSWAAITPPEWREADARAIRQLKLTGVAAPWEKEFFAKDGHRVPVLVGIATVEYPNCIAFMADLTGRKDAEQALRRTEDQLRQTQKMEAVGRLAGGVAHDFNNVLSVILSYGALIYDSLRPDDPMREDAGEIVKAGARAAELTHQLLTFSRQQVVQARILDLSDVLKGMDKMLRRILGEDVELTSVVAVPAGRVRADCGHIEQVIMNLVINARDAMPGGGKLSLEVSNVELDEHFVRSHHGAKVGPHVMLAVTDTGVGMDEATQRRIFEPFFTTKEVGKGTGLGLSTVFGIVQQSGGTLWVQSEPGRGTTFKVYLPRVDAVADAAPATVAPVSRRGSETILLVEDEDQVRVVARGILARSGYRVLEARNAGEALLLCEKQAGAIHLLLSDIVMPQMSGPELAQRLAGVRPEMKVLCMSGYTDERVVRHGLDGARVAFIQKPITPNTLTRKVREVLDSVPSA